VAFRKVVSKPKGYGFFEDEVADVGDGQTQNMQQSFG
jgi:hypothetical protein